MEHEQRQYARMLDIARQRLSDRTPQQLAARTGAQAAGSTLSLHSFGQPCSLCLPMCQFQPELSKWHTLTLLHYLDLSDGTVPTGQLISFSHYPSGLARGGGFDREAERCIAAQLGTLPPEELHRRCRSLGGTALPSNADLCVQFFFAPHYPLWLKLWFADEDFPASGRLLLDETAPHHLSLEDAVTVGSLLLDQLCRTSHWTV